MAAFGYNASDEELAQLEQLREELVKHLHSFKRLRFKSDTS